MKDQKQLQAIADEYFKNSSAVEILVTDDGAIFTPENEHYAESHRQKIKGEKVYSFKKGAAAKKEPAKKDEPKKGDDLDGFKSAELVDIASQKGSKKTKRELAKMSDKDLKKHILSL